MNGVRTAYEWVDGFVTMLLLQCIRVMRWYVLYFFSVAEYNILGNKNADVMMMMSSKKELQKASSVFTILEQYVIDVLER